jgi:hypothetical protein
MTEGLSEGEIMQLVNRYIGVSGGYLGVPYSFTYRTHGEFYAEFCNLSVALKGLGATREVFMATVASLPPRDQAKVLHGVIDCFPPTQEGGPVSRSEMATKLQVWIARLESAPLVGKANLPISKEAVMRALADVDTLIAAGKPLSAVDRVHTALHGYLQDACLGEQITYQRKDSVVNLLRKLQNKHSGFQEVGPRRQDIMTVVNAFAQVLDALLPVRNNATLAHPNDTLLGDDEAYLFINAARTIFQYLDAKMSKT